MKTLISFLSILLFATAVMAQVPSTISYQGFYTDGNGVPINDGVNDKHIVKFDFFKGTDANSTFSRTIENVKVSKGLFSVTIGRNVTAEDGPLNTALPVDNFHGDITYSVQVSIDGIQIGNKIPLTSVPYALTAAKVDGANITGTLPDARLESTVDINALNVGATGQFSVSSNGNLSKIKDLTYDFPSSHNAGTTFLSNNGSGTLSWSGLPSNVPTGSGANNSLTLWTGTGSLGNDTDLSWDGLTNTLSATNFSGNGAGLTSLPAASLTGNGTLPTGVLPATVPLGNGATNSLTLWTGTGSVGHDANLSWNGTSNTLSATNFSGNGALLTSLAAANITGTNTLPVGVLPTTVPLGTGVNNRLTLWSGTSSVSSNANLTWNGTTNTLSANNFTGNGSGLTSILGSEVGSGVSGSNITTGTISDNRLEPTIDRTIFNASDYITAVGGAYIGANSDPGDGNLVVTGKVRLDNTPNFTDPYVLEVEGTSTGAVMKIHKNQVAGTSLLDFYRSNTLVGNISEASGTVSYNPFTGSHFGYSSDDMVVGTVVYMTGHNIKMNDAPDGEPIYEIHPTNKPNDPRVLGAYLHEVDSWKNNPTPNVKAIMAVGNGSMWIADNGLDVHVGDYLISSDLEGHAMKDNGSYEVSYIIGRAGEDVAWSSNEELIEGRKHKKISVFFENFTINHKAERLQEEISQLQQEMANLRMKHQESNEQLYAEINKIKLLLPDKPRN